MTSREKAIYGWDVRTREGSPHRRLRGQGASASKGDGDLGEKSSGCFFFFFFFWMFLYYNEEFDSRSLVLIHQDLLSLTRLIIKLVCYGVLKINGVL